jgi:hypothetical protein
MMKIINGGGVGQRWTDISGALMDINTQRNICRVANTRGRDREYWAPVAAIVVPRGSIVRRSTGDEIQDS